MVELAVVNDSRLPWPTVAEGNPLDWLLSLMMLLLLMETPELVAESQLARDNGEAVLRNRQFPHRRIRLLLLRRRCLR